MDIGEKMAESDSPLVPPEHWPRVQELFLILLELPEAEQKALLAAEASPVVVHWVRELLDEEAPDFEPPNLHEELPKLRIESTIASRYRLEEHIGSGGYGDVYRADDRLTRQSVAVKMIPSDPDDAVEPHEWATLRVLNLPGVVSLLDAQESDGEIALVMPLLGGAPFPGECPGTWEAIGERVIGLLEALERLHAAGFVHGDLKPSNVLVDEGGHPAILDLGVARRWRRGGTASELVVGTPSYAAPELFIGQLPSPASDLYSVGLMVYEALTGALPDLNPAIPLVRLQSRTVTPISKRVPDLPPQVVEFVDALLRPVETRPTSATDALEILGRGTLEDRLREHLGSLGSPDELSEIAMGLQAGRSFELKGELQAGKSNLLDEIAGALEAVGERVLLFRGDDEALIRMLCSEEELLVLGEWSEAREFFLDRLKREHDTGAFLLFDDVEKVRDSELSGAMEERASRGRVATVRTDPIEPSRALAPLGETDLRELFEGPDAVLHLREDAAWELYARTGGWRGRVIRELAAWVRAGFLRLGEPGQVVITRDTIDRLAVLSPMPLRSLAGGTDSLDDQEKRLLAFVQLAPGGASREYLERADPGDALHLVERIASLTQRGLLTESDLRIHVRCRIPLHAVLSDAEQARAHRLIAEEIPGDDPRRLHHRILAGESSQIPSDALTLGRQALAQGQPGRAHAVLLEGLRRATGLPSDLEGEILEELVESALTLQSQSAMQRALHEIALSGTPTKARLEPYRVATIGLRLQERDRASALAAIREFQPPHDPRWRRWLAMLMAFAGRLTHDEGLHAESTRTLVELVEGGDRPAIRDLAVVLGAYCQ